MKKGKTNVYIIFFFYGTKFAERIRGMTVRSFAVGWSVSFIPHTALHCNILDCIVLDCNVWHRIISDWIVLESTALYATQLLYIGVHCTLCLGTVHKLWQPYLGVSVTVGRVNFCKKKQQHTNMSTDVFIVSLGALINHNFFRVIAQLLHGLNLQFNLQWGLQ